MKIPEITISLKFSDKVKKSELHKISNSADIYNLCKEVFNSDTVEWVESFIIFCLNRANKVVGFYKVSQGGMSGTVADPKVIFTIALNCAASAIICAHNHPSGHIQPSEADIKLTHRIKEGALLLDMRLLDHIIIGDEKYYSFADEGTL